MPYSTFEDLKKTVPLELIRQLVTDEGDGTLIAAETEARALESGADADSEIDQYLEPAGYTVPLSTVPPMIRGFSCDIWAYKLYKRKDVVPESRRNAYKDAVATLKDIRDGKMKLPALLPASEAVFSSGALVTSHFGDEDT